ncbi:hypothetical protein SUGI_1002090 [Cryptomeria japonica]|nr:hypothetical protein SUGI_1002090 [Cryptomeria japonica]
MDSLELSLFTPDFTITSFYKVFGSDPTGLGCLFIKDSVLGCLQNKENTGTGMVSIIHVSPQYLSDSGERRDGTVQESDGTNEIGEDGYGSKFSIRPHLPAFSGAFSSAQVRDVFEIDEIMKSPIFSEEENEDAICIDLGESPGGLNTQRNFKKSPPSNLGLRQLHNGFSQRTKHKKSSTETISKSSTEDYGNGPTYDEEKKSLGVNNEIVSFDAAVSSDDIKKATSKKSREIDTRESVYNGQGKSHADQDPSKPNGNSFSHGSSQGDNLLLEDEMGISRRVDSQRFPKQTWITFNLDGEGSVSAGYEIDDNRDKGGSHTSEQSMGIAEEVVQSVSSEISSCDKDDKQFMERPIHAKQNIVNATTSLANGPREPGKICFLVESKQNPAENGCITNESCIREETEGAFRLLDSNIV